MCSFLKTKVVVLKTSSLNKKCHKMKNALYILIYIWGVLQKYDNFTSKVQTILSYFSDIFCTYIYLVRSRNTEK